MILLIKDQFITSSKVFIREINEGLPKNICNEFHQGDLFDFDTVYNFGKKVDLLTIEIENVNIDALDKLESEGLTIYPKPKDLRIIQNKATQKLFYIDHEIPTSPFSRFTSLQELKHSYSNGAIEFPCVWKSARFGYKRI